MDRLERGVPVRLPNFVLLGSFLGIGIGFLRGHARYNLFPYAPVALAFLVGFVVIFPVQIDRAGGDLIYFGGYNMTGLPTWVTLPAVFLAVAGVMEMIAEGVARTFVEFTPLEAYRWDISGSILGSSPSRSSRSRGRRRWLGAWWRESCSCSSFGRACGRCSSSRSPAWW